MKPPSPTIRDADRAGFTPGPWHIRPEEFDRPGAGYSARLIGANIGPGGESIRQADGGVLNGGIWVAEAKGPDADANAALIAAAPALFEALRAFVAQYDAIPDEVLTSRMHESPAVMRIVRARSALALAQPKADQGGE